MGLTLAVGAAAVNTGNNLLYAAVAMNLSLVLVSGILSEGCLRRAAVSVAAAPEVFEGREGLLRIGCSAGGGFFPLPPLALRVEIPFCNPPVRALIPSVAAGKETVRIVPFRPGRRGILSSNWCVVSTRFPFGLFEKSAVVPLRGAVVVYPRPAGAAALPPGGGARSEVEGVAAAGRSGPQVRGARELLPTDPARDVHWKASARLGKWMAKEREAQGAPPVDITVPAGLPPSVREQALQAACGLILRLEREGRPFRLRLGGKIAAGPADSDRRAKALSALALFEAERKDSAEEAP